MLHDNPVEIHWAPEIFLFEASSAYTLAPGFSHETGKKTMGKILITRTSSHITWSVYLSVYQYISISVYRSGYVRIDDIIDRPHKLSLPLHAAKQPWNLSSSALPDRGKGQMWTNSDLGELVLEVYISFGGVVVTDGYDTPIFYEAGAFHEVHLL